MKRRGGGGGGERTLQTRADRQMKRLGTQTITNTGRETATCKDWGDGHYKHGKTDRGRDWGHGQSQTRTERETDEETGDTDNHKHGQTERQMQTDRQRSVRGN